MIAANNDRELLQQLESHLTLKSKPWRCMRNAMVLGQPIERHMGACRAQVSALVNCYLRKHNTDSLMASVIKEYPGAAKGLISGLGSEWPADVRYHAWLACAKTQDAELESHEYSMQMFTRCHKFLEAQAFHKLASLQCANRLEMLMTPYAGSPTPNQTLAFSISIPILYIFSHSNPSKQTLDKHVTAVHRHIYNSFVQASIDLDLLGEFVARYIPPEYHSKLPDWIHMLVSDYFVLTK